MNEVTCLRAHSWPWQSQNSNSRCLTLRWALCPLYHNCEMIFQPESCVWILFSQIIDEYVHRVEIKGLLKWRQSTSINPPSPWASSVSHWRRLWYPGESPCNTLRCTAISVRKTGCVSRAPNLSGRLQTNSSGDASGATAFRSNFLDNSASSNNIYTSASQTWSMDQWQSMIKLSGTQRRRRKIRTTQPLLIQLHVFNLKNCPLFSDHIFIS